jgi:hypothetical protein
MDEFEEIVEQIATAMKMPAVPVSAYRTAESENSARTRVVFVPTDFEPRSNVGTGPRITQNGSLVHAILTETWTVECVIFGDRRDDTERVRRRIISVIRPMFGTACRFMGGNWPTQGASEARVSSGGAEIARMRMQWDLELFEDPLPPQVELENDPEIEVGPFPPPQGDDDA